MAWADSRISRAFETDVHANAAAFDLSGASVDTFKAALYNNSITPDRDATSANFAYNVDQWATAQEVSESGQWATGGVALVSPALTNPSSGVVMWDANDTASGSAADLASVYGCLVYDDTLASPVADQGVCFNYFGGSNSVVNGTFTIIWHANGLWRITV
jgi:hypothetical protein